MNPSTSWGGIALIVAVGAASSSTGCSSVLGLDDFTEAEAGATTATGSTTSTGDATTTTTGTDTTTSGPGGGGDGGSTTGSTSSAGGGGSGGAGGGGVTVECAAGQPFELFTTLELAGGELDDERMLVVSRPNSNRVHVGFPVYNAGVGGSRIVARTVRLATPPDLREIVTYPTTADNLYRRVIGAYTTPVGVHFWGVEGGVPGEFVFFGNDDISPQGGASFVPYPAPQECTSFRGLAVNQDEAGVVRFAASCTTAPPAAESYMYVGTRDQLEIVIGPVPVDFNGDPPADLRVRAFGRAGGRNVVYTGEDELAPDDGGFLRTGNTAQDLANLHPVIPPDGHGLIMLAGPEVEGRLFMAALHLDPSTFGSANIDGAYRTGAVAPGDLTALAADPVATLPHAIPFEDPASLAPPFIVQRAGEFVIGAGVASFDLDEPTSTRLTVWGGGGEVLVNSFPVAVAEGNVRFLAAGAAGGGFGTIAVAWSELVGDAYRVRGAGVQCLAE